MASARFTIPGKPPSANRYWRRSGNRMYVSREAKAYREAVAVAAYQAGPFDLIDGPVILVMKWYRPARRGDLDNRLKPLLDALQGVVFEDDKQVVDIHASRHEDKHNPRVVVSVCSAVYNEGVGAWEPRSNNE